MKKHKLIFILTILILILLCSCKSRQSRPVNELTEVSEICSEIKFTNTEYNIDTDCQNYLTAGSYEYASAGTGYIFSELKESGLRYILYYDIESGLYIPICQRSDCEHNDESCDAVIDTQSGNLLFYNNKIYYTSMASEKGYYIYSLYKMNFDGTMRAKVKEFIRIKSIDGSASRPQLSLHRGYAYFVYTDNINSYLYRFKLDDKSDIEEICRCSRSISFISNIQGYGDGILFQCYYYDEDFTDIADINEKIFYYSNDTDEVKLLVDGNIGSYSLIGNGIIYSDGKDTLVLSFDDFTSSVFISDEVFTVSYDGKNIYLDNLWECDNVTMNYDDRKVKIYDTSGNFIDVINLPGYNLNFYFGDSRCLFSFIQQDDGGYKLHVFDKSQLGTGSHDWKELSWNK